MNGTMELIIEIARVSAKLADKGYEDEASLAAEWLKIAIKRLNQIEAANRAVKEMRAERLKGLDIPL